MGDYLKEQYFKARMIKDLPVGTQRFIKNYKYAMVYNATGTAHRGFNNISIFIKHTNVNDYDIDYYVDGELYPREQIESIGA